MTVGFPGGKPRLIPTRPSIRARTVIGGKVAKATRTQGGHSSRSSNTTRPRALGPPTSPILWACRLRTLRRLPVFDDLEERRNSERIGLARQETTTSEEEDDVGAVSRDETGLILALVSLGFLDVRIHPKNATANPESRRRRRRGSRRERRGLAPVFLREGDQKVDDFMRLRSTIAVVAAGEALRTARASSSPRNTIFPDA
ncbi:hypothetical protein Bca101_037776 [Brassica carinata]